MKKTLILAILSIALVQCKKEGTPEPTPTQNTPSEENNKLFPDADAVLSTMYYTSDFGNTYVYQGNFFSSTSNGNVGTLKANDLTVDFESQDSIYFLDDDVSTKITDVKWDLTGTSPFGSFAYTDKALFGKIVAENIPDTIPSTDALNFTFTQENAKLLLVVIYSPYSGETIELELQAGATTVSLTNAQVKKLVGNMVGEERNITVSMLPYNYTKITTNGKGIYFVKGEGHDVNVYVK